MSETPSFVQRMALKRWTTAGIVTPLLDKDSETFMMNIVKGVKDTGPALRLGYGTHIENTVSL